MENEQGIYAILEDLLRPTKTPLTCVDLFADQRIKKFASDPNRVSDYVGHMWRRGLLQRWTAPKDLSSKARYAYTWKEPGSPIKVPDKELHPLPELRIVKTPKQQFTVTEQEDQITIEFEEFVIKIQSK